MYKERKSCSKTRAERQTTDKFDKSNNLYCILNYEKEKTI